MEYCEYEGGEEESHYSTPVLKARATATAGYTQTTHSIPAPVAKPVKRSNSFLFSFGLGMCIVVVLLMLWSMVLVPWWHSVTVRWTYGTSQVSIFGADVEHGGVSRFIAFEDGSEIVIVEAVTKKYTIYTIPVNGEDGRLVTLSVADVNNDGKPDLIVHVDGQEGSFALINNGSSFDWSH